MRPSSSSSPKYRAAGATTAPAAATTAAAVVAGAVSVCSVCRGDDDGDCGTGGDGAGTDGRRPGRW